MDSELHRPSHIRWWTENFTSSELVLTDSQNSSQVSSWTTTHFSGLTTCMFTCIFFIITIMNN